MEKVIHRSESRGVTDQGWLKSLHTFSFGNYYDPRRIHFGALRILNDNIVEGGEGLSSHPHDNMEIVSLPLRGSIEHGDSLGNVSVISTGDVHVMSAGTGIIHNEYNRSADEQVEFLQLWFFPEEYELPPDYSHVTVGLPQMNELQLIVAPEKELKENSVGNTAKIRQNVWFYQSELDKGVTVRHKIRSDRNGAYLFVLDGEVLVDESKLYRHDGIGIWDADIVEVTSAAPGTRILLIELPMRNR